MARHDVYENPDGNGYLLDLQSDFCSVLDSRIVAPLVPLEDGLLYSAKLNPVFEIRGERYFMLTQAMSAIPAGMLRKKIASLSGHFDEITRAIDMIFQGF